MARVILPLLSLSASGKFGNSIIFIKGKFGNNNVRFQPMKRWKLTPRRLYMLRKFSEMSNEWWLLSPAERQDWNVKARQVRDSGYAYFIKKMLTGVHPPF